MTISNEIALAEYSELKNEQRTRMTIRDSLPYYTFAALGASLGFGLNNKSLSIILLAVPLICYTLGWTYLRNNAKISEIGKYIAQTTHAGWETHRLTVNGRQRTHIMQLSVDLTMFITTGFIAIGIYWTTNPNPLTFLTSIVELAMLVILGIEFVRQADLRKTT